MTNAIIFLILGLVGEGSFLYHSRESGRRHDALVNRLLKQNAALTTALVHKDGAPVASAILQTYSDTDEPTEALRQTKQAKAEESHLLGLQLAAAPQVA